MSHKLNSKVPSGDIEKQWDEHRFNLKLINPSNRRKYRVIIVGTGLAGASAAASFAEMGYSVDVFCFQDSPRRAHSIAAQGGINAAKNYCNDGDSVYRLFHDTIKGGDFRSRESNVYRLAQNSVNIIDQCVAQGVPFAREYGGHLANRSFGGAQVSRTFYAKGQTGQQLLLGAYSAMMKEVHRKRIRLHTKTELLDLVLVDGKARGIITRHLETGEIEAHSAETVILATGGYSNVFFLSTNAKGCNVTATWRAHKKGAFFANPCFTQIHPTCIPVKGDYQSKLTLMSESLRNDGRVWVPKDKNDKRHPNDIAESERSYYLEERYPSFGNLVPRDLASRNAKYVCDEGLGVGATGLAVYLDFADAIKRDGRLAIEQRYGNLFEIYERITGEDPYTQPMMIYPAVHYTMGGLWVDYNLMTTIPGLHVLGEANFSDHGANRLGASALMQGLSDGYFVAPYTVPDYLARTDLVPITTDNPEFSTAIQACKSRIETLLSIKGDKTVDYFHRELGLIMWDKCGMSRTKPGLEEALSAVTHLEKEFWSRVNVPGSADTLNQSLEKAGRVADFFEFSKLKIKDALHRNESCGGHFREEYQSEEGEAVRDDSNFKYVAAWELDTKTGEEVLHKEDLEFPNAPLSTRSYK
ncbi:succinate dehydrogenase flavoprotein subunit [bacterium]|nr:succinate dehydrogenase flavoprotein subunit [bacterium]|tara:strand:+ start:6247 stop:8166 length:1920 start_codon:yes stop_codon:yes gene_type:complete